MGHNSNPGQMKVPEKQSPIHKWGLMVLGIATFFIRVAWLWLDRRRSLLEAWFWLDRPFGYGSK